MFSLDKMDYNPISMDFLFFIWLLVTLDFELGLGIMKRFRRKHVWKSQAQAQVKIMDV